MISSPFAVGGMCSLARDQQNLKFELSFGRTYVEVKSSAGCAIPFGFLKEPAGRYSIPSLPAGDMPATAHTLTAEAAAAAD
jgi:hypothetical protein